MDMQSLLSSFFGPPEFEGKALQRQGEVTRDQIVQFFSYGKQLFADQEFKLGLAMAQKQHKDLQSIIDRAQAQLWEQKVTPAVQGDFGISSLSRIRQRFQNDAEMLKMFYEFVHLEEKTLDEAEMPADMFEKKYQSIYQMKRVMEQKMAEHREELEKLSPEDQEKYMAQVFKTMVEQSSGGGACCGPKPAAMPNLPPKPTTKPPTPEDGPTAHPSNEQAGSKDGEAAGASSSSAGPSSGPPGAPADCVQLEHGRVMLSAEEQWAFFNNLHRKG